MKRIHTLLAIGCGLLFAASTCFAQMYTVNDLGTLGGEWSDVTGINASGQVAGSSGLPNAAGHAFRTAPNRPINPHTDDLGTLGIPFHSEGWGINDSGQVVGGSFIQFFRGPFHAFRTSPNESINPATDDLGALSGGFSTARGVNSSGQVVGYASVTSGPAEHAFRTGPNRPIDPATDDLGTLGGLESQAADINAFGQVVGMATLAGDTEIHAFRTRPNRRINPATDDLGTFGGSVSYARGINDFGQVVGSARLPGDTVSHAFRTASNRSINPATDDLGTLGGTFSDALGINNYGQVTGLSYLPGDSDEHAFLYDGGKMQDLTTLIESDSSCEIARIGTVDINDAGQMAGSAICTGQTHAVRLDPIYHALVQQPINADGSSVFKNKRGTIPVKFRLTQHNARTCNLLPATLAITRASGGKLRSVDENEYGRGSSFKITGCQYHYNLVAKELGAGVYRADISINGIMVGHAVFAVK